MQAILSGSSSNTRADLANGIVMERHDGPPCGVPLSPLVVNVLPNVVDKQFERRGHWFVRYADDWHV